MTENSSSFPSVHLSEFEPVPPDVIALLPAGLVNKQMIVPLKKHDGHLIVATPKVEGVVKPEGLALVTGCPVEFVLAPVDEITNFIKKHYTVQGAKKMMIIPADLIVNAPAPAPAPVIETPPPTFAAPVFEPVVEAPVLEVVAETPHEQPPIIFEEEVKDKNPDDTLAIYVDKNTFEPEIFEDPDISDLDLETTALIDIAPSAPPVPRIIPPPPTFSVIKPEPLLEPEPEKETPLPILEAAPASVGIPSELLKLVTDAVRARASEVLINIRNDKVQTRHRLRGVYMTVDLGKGALYPAEVEKLLAWLKNVGDKQSTGMVEWTDYRKDIRIGDELYAVNLFLSENKESKVLTAKLRSQKESGFSPSTWGMDPSQIKIFTEFMGRTQGLILFAGAEREGLTGNLHACANQLATPNRHVVAVEPHMESWLSGIDQYFSKGDPKLFSQLLQVAAKHSPDVLIANPLELKEHFDACLSEALKGRLVLGRSYAVDCADALVQLASMGVEPYLVGSALAGVISKRTLRMNCPVCQIKDPTAKSQARELGIPDAMQPSCFYVSKGCESCNMTGFTGETDIFEILQMTTDLRNVFNKDVRVESIQSHIKSSGLLTLRQVALHKAINGQTSLAEVLRTTSR